MEAVKHISPRAERLISEYGQGNIRAEYKGDWWKGELGTAMILLAAPLMWVWFLLLYLPSFTANSNWLEQLGYIALPLLILGPISLLAGIIGIIFLAVGLWRGEQHIYQGEKGFISARRRIETVVRWETVQEVRRHIQITSIKINNVQKIISDCSYTIIPAEGKKCFILAEPGPAIEQAATAYLLPRALENYAAGQMLSFDWLALDNKGLHILASGKNPAILVKLPERGHAWQKLKGACIESNERFLPWEKLACGWIDESHSTLVLSKKDERKHWAILPLYQIPNAALFLSLVKHVLYGNTYEINTFSKVNESTTSRPVSQRASGLHEEYPLGLLIETYQTRVTRLGVVVFLILVAAILLMVGLLVSLLIWVLPPLLNGPSLFPLPVLIVSRLALPLFMIWVCWTLFSQSGLHNLIVTPVRRKIVVSLYANGLVYHEGRKQQVVTWEQIRFIERLMIKRWETPLRHYKLILADMTEITLPVVIANVQKLGATIEQEFIKRLLPEMLANYTANKPVVFPGLCLNQDGISKSDENLLWQEVEQITISLEKLTIKKRGIAKDWLTAPIAQIRNICLLEALLEHIKEEKGFSIDNNTKQHSTPAH